MWAARAAKMDFRWKLGKGDKIRFWEDQCFDTCSLAIQFLDIYSIVNEQGCTITKAWDGVCRGKLPRVLWVTGYDPKLQDMIGFLQ
jgi:hypothetical protein